MLVRMSMTLGMAPKITGAPGANVWIMAMWASTSALATASVPANVAGAVAPAIGME